MMPLFSYFGSKIRLGGRYPRPLYPTIVEPFAGAAGYSCHHWRRNCILYDINPVVYGVLKYMRDAKPADIMTLPLATTCTVIDELPICQEAKWMLGFWMGVASTSPAKTPHKWVRSDAETGHSQTSHWGKACRRRAAVAVSRIKHWKVHNDSYEKIDVNAIGPATWFVDPPYQKQGVNYKFGSKQIDFTKLGEWCMSLPGQVIVCENEGADWLPFRMFASIVGANALVKGEKLRRSVEVIWTKGCNQYPTLFGRE